MAGAEWGLRGGEAGGVECCAPQVSPVVLGLRPAVLHLEASTGEPQQTSVAQALVGTLRKTQAWVP